MRPYICISHASADADAAQRFLRELTRYGFRYEAPDESVPRREREEYLLNAGAVVVLTSPAAAGSGVCAADIRLLLGRGREVLCVSLAENALDSRFCSDREQNAVCIAYPAGDVPDRSTVAYYIHSLYLSRLCRRAEAFSAVRCVDDAYGRLIRLAVQAHRICAGERFGRRDEYAAAVQAVGELADAYRTGETAPRLEDEAVAWLERGAALGQPDSMLRLADWKIAGGAVRRDPAGALALFRRAADGGDVRGLYQVGRCALEGIGMMRDPQAAADAFARAAAAGYLPARYRLGLLRRDGVGIPADWYGAAYDLYAACAELTGYRPPETGIGAPPPQAPGEVVRPVEPRPARAPGETPRDGRVRRSVSMRKLREDRLGRLLFGSDDVRSAAASVTPAQRAAAVEERRRRIRDCMARNRYRRVGAADSRRLEVALSAGLSPHTGDGWSDWDPSAAAYALGRMLESGCRVADCPPLPLHALYWYRTAALRGHGGAVLRLAECCRLGLGVPRDGNEAVHLYRAAARLGDPEAQFRLGVCCEQGLHTRQDAAEAAHWYTEAAKSGYAPAQNNLGGCYERGAGVRQDMISAVECYRRAAQAGVPEAACRLGLCFERGTGVRADAARALSLYEQAAQAGHPYAMYRLGLCYDWGRAVQPQFARAAQLYAQAAQAGVPEAAYAIGLCCRDGRGVSRDGGLAFSWFAASAAGCAQGALEAGLCLSEGQGAIRKPEEAMRYFAAAAASDPATGADEPWQESLPAAPVGADQLYGGASDSVPAGGAVSARPDSGGDLPPAALSATETAAEALYRLAYCRLAGIGLPGAAGSADTAPAADLLTRAARLGSAKACLAAGELCAAGRLNPEGMDAADAAVLWYRRALHCPPTPAAGSDRACAEARLRLAQDCFRRAQACAAVPEGTDVTDGVAVPDSANVPEGAGTPDADAWNRRGWIYLTGAAEGGSAEALIRMAECAFRGIGTPCKPAMAKALLEGVRRRFGSRHDGTVCLWLGDFALTDTGAPVPDATPDTTAVWDSDRRRRAAALYRQAIAAPAPPVRESSLYAAGGASGDGPDSRSGAENRQERARGEAMYRLALLEISAPEVSGGEADDRPLVWLCRAVLAGHPAARRDFARMLAHESEQEENGRRELEAAWQALREKSGGTGRRGARLARALWERTGEIARQDPTVWMREYYTVLAPVPEPFRYTDETWELSGTAAEDSAVYARAAVTPRMDAESMYYLGECLFRGLHMPADRAAAVLCYRQAAAYTPGRGEPVCRGALWAQYSLGWCLVRGVGCPGNPREGVAWLSRASKYHGQAAYMLAECYERGIGVDVPDTRSAITCYRRALKLGCRQAAVGVAAMEKALRSKENAD